MICDKIRDKMETQTDICLTSLRGFLQVEYIANVLYIHLRILNKYIFVS